MVIAHYLPICAIIYFSSTELHTHFPFFPSNHFTMIGVTTLKLIDRARRSAFFTSIRLLKVAKPVA